MSMYLGRSQLLVNAIVDDEMTIVHRLLDSGLSPKCILHTPLLRASALSLASSLGRTRIVALLVGRLLVNTSSGGGGDTCFLDFKDPSFGRTPLHEASIAGHVDVIDILLRHGSDINTRDHNGSTALIMAASFGQLDAVSILLERGASVLVKDRLGATAIHYSTWASPRLDPITSLLISAGCLCNISSYQGIGSPLANLLPTNNAKIIKFLLHAGYDISNDLDIIATFIKEFPSNEVTALLISTRRVRSLYSMCKTKVIQTLVSMENRGHIKDKIHRLPLPKIVMIDVQIS